MLGTVTGGLDGAVGKRTPDNVRHDELALTDLDELANLRCRRQ